VGGGGKDVRSEEMVPRSRDVGRRFGRRGLMVSDTGMEEKKENPPETADVQQTEQTKLIADQQRRVDALEKVSSTEPSEAHSLELTRERDRLRHYLQAQKGNPHERAAAKANYATGAALSRAIKPLGE
jgi:hypothetical protein